MKAINAWKTLRPQKSFANMTLDQFTAKMQPSLVPRAAIIKADEDRAVAVTQRDNADATTMPILDRLVAAVIADEEEGNDGELYEQMGYVRKSQRGSGLHRNAPPPPPATPPSNPPPAN